MPTKNVVLPASFLQALEEARRNPQQFISKNGEVKCLPFVGGGAEGDAGAEQGQGEGEAESKDGKESETDSDADKDETGDSEEDDDKELPDSVKAILSKNRRERREAQRKAALAEQKAADAEAKAKQYEDRDKSELERATGERDTLRAENDELRKSNKRLALRSAFLADNTVDWVDPDDALEMALRSFGLEDLEVSDSGRVDGKALKKILAEMAREKKYLVNSAAGDRQGKPSGGSYNGGSKGSAKDAKSPDALAHKYPAMRGRRKVT